MKIIKMIMLLALVCGCCACQKDTGSDPEFGPDEVYIYDDKPATMAVTVGVEAIFEMVVSPNNGTAACRWLLDGAVIGTEPKLVHTFTAKGTFVLRFEATRGATTIGKSIQLTVN